MTRKIPDSFIHELLSRTSLHNVISQHVQLKSFGGNFKGLCPFHKEKTPSFSVNETKQFYHCFGCKASGNAITFLMEYERLDFVTAIEKLASMNGMTIPESNDEHSNLRKKINNTAETLDQIAKRYQQHLTLSQTAKDYVASRKITSSVATMYEIGYALDQWDDISKAFNQRKQLLIDVGMITPKQNQQCYDKFRDRLIFPIRNEKGMCIGFGGRTINDQTPKYLNSSDSFIFKKGAELYGLYQVLQSKKKPDNIIVVEGYMDVVALANHNINHCVASLGTAITTQQIKKMIRYTKKIVFCFDGDNAGKKAAWKALLNTLPLMHHGIYVKFVFLPEGEDPDSYIMQHGKSGLAALFKKGMDVVRYLFSHVKTQYPTSSISDQTNFINACRAIIDPLPESVFKTLLNKSLSEQVGLAMQQMPSQNKEVKPATIKSASNQDIPPLTEQLFALYIQNPMLIYGNKSLRNEIEAIDNSLALSTAITNLVNAYNTINTSHIVEHYRTHALASTIAHLASVDIMIPHDGIESECRDIIVRIQRQNTQNKLDELLHKSRDNVLSEAERKRIQNLLLMLKKQ